ncbi:HNH endonuclease signature motif containing protein [Streptomyces morookaense]|uniref:HNH endonuclease n=1 Tax=Streptomyces morookaense TaxID=1970 RepID=A0A7Y7E9S5_STRMO|nr:HNH endonuclease signature motif containing protein [Streptomyces morookaense]NVK81405.1 HNH endonuclease [Streptomyces morookaense]GHF45367.1 hypothetical protein GCM10010359_55000 [Streptomyces morookaense]
MPVSPYTRERLAAAAASSRTLSEALRRLGVDPKSSSRSYLRERMNKMGVDTSRFEPEGTRWSRETLEAAVAASSNMCDVLRRLGVDVVGGQHTHISRRIRALGIDTSHFDTAGPATRRKKRTSTELLAEQVSPGSRREQNSRLRQAMLKSGIADRCSLCGMEPVWKGYPLPLEVDHIDGDWRNNHIANLRLLCPNCHATTDTYRGRAKARRTAAPRPPQPGDSCR